MGIRIIPRACEYTCDRCDEKQVQTTNGNHEESRPPHWAQLRLARTGYDPQGVACADLCVEKLLCPGCAEDVVHAVNDALMRMD